MYSPGGNRALTSRSGCIAALIVLMLTVAVLAVLVAVFACSNRPGRAVIYTNR